MKTIFKLEKYYYRGVIRYPIKEINNRDMGLYYTLNAALRVMQQQIVYDVPDNDTPKRQRETTVCYVITEIKPNENTNISIRSYDGQGVFNTESLCKEEGPFCGRELGQLRFKIGDIVQVVNHNYLEIGIIDGLSPSPEEINRRNARRLEFGGTVWYDDQGDDCYYTVHCGGTEENLYNHDHPACWMVFPASRKLPKRIVAELMSVHEAINEEEPLTATE